MPQSSNNPAIRVCIFCNQKVTRPVFIEHLRVCKKRLKSIVQTEGLFTCHIKNCGKTFANLQLKQQHHYAQHRLTKARCPIKNCNIVVNKKSLQQHIQNLHMEMRSTCKKCKKQYRPNYIREHEKRCGKVNFRSRNMSLQIDCQLPQQSNFKKVKPEIPKSKKLSKFCNRCCKNIHIWHFNRHQLRCEVKKRLGCPVPGCDSKFVNLQSQKSHIHQKHPGSMICLYPGCKRSIKATQLWTHMKLSHGHLTPGLFKVKRNVGQIKEVGKILQQAKNVESEHSSKKIQENIGNIINEPSKPMNARNKMPTLKCTICGEPFFKIVTLKNHMKRHHTDPIPCTYEGCNVVLMPHLLFTHKKYLHPEVKDDGLSTSYKMQRTQKLRKRLELAQRTKLKMDRYNNRHKCPYFGCRHYFSIESSLADHMAKDHKTLIPCPFEECDFISEPKELKTHMKNDSHEIDSTLIEGTSRRKRLVCLVRNCEVVCSNENSRTIHLANQHPKPVPCAFPNCQDLISSSQLSFHMKFKHGGINITPPKIEQPEDPKINQKLFKSKLSKIFDLDCLRKYMVQWKENEQHIFKCPVLNCPSIANSSKRQNAHFYNFHKKPYSCPYKGCQITLGVAPFISHIKYCHNPFELLFDRWSDKRLLKQVIEKRGCFAGIQNVDRKSVQQTTEASFLKCEFNGCKSIFVSKKSKAIHVWRFHQDSGRNKIVDHLSMQNHDQKIEKSLPNLLKCEIEKCLTVWKSAKALSRHRYMVHFKPIPCIYCGLQIRPIDMRNHEEQNHLSLKKKDSVKSEDSDSAKSCLTMVLCPNPECKSIVRGSELEHHLQREHKNFRTKCYKCCKLLNWSSIIEHIRNCPEVALIL